MPTEPALSAEAIFSEAIAQKDPASRQDYIAQACAGNAALIKEINELVAAHESAGAFLKETVVLTAKELGPPDDSPPNIPGFQIRRMLGRGGLGAVYEAFDDKLQRAVALKVLTRPASAPGGARVLAEARKAASLNHPGIVTIYSVHEEGSSPAISMEVIEGFPVDRATAGLNFEQKARILQKIAQAMAVAHGAGMIHRDLKPENILVTPDLQPKILDFGIALSLDEAGATRSMFAGTPAYASPEQIKLQPLTTASDIFSFGAVMFKILTGRPAFGGANTLEILAAICASDPPFPRDVAVGVPEDLQAICLACLARDPKARPSAADVAVDFARYLAGEPVRLRPALYGDILRRKISDYDHQLRHWQQQGMISGDEGDRLETVHRRILADEDHWIIDARKISLNQSILYTATWLVVLSSTLAVWLAREQLSQPLPWLLPVFLTAWLLGAGILSRRRKEPIAGASFLAGAILSLAPTTLALLKEARLLDSAAADVKQLLPDFTNVQLLLATCSAFFLSGWTWWRLRMTGFAWTTAILGAVTYWSFLLCLNWLDQRPATMALWLTPLIAAEIAGLACERARAVRWALPFHLIALITLVACLDTIAFQGPTLAMLGVPENDGGFWNADRLSYLSIALNGYLFLGIVLLTERSKSLDLRRAARLLEPLALLHMLGPLYANAANNRAHPDVKIDMLLYLATVTLLLILGPWRSSWRMLVGALGGLAFGSYLLIDLQLVGKATFTLALGFLGLTASAATFWRLSKTLKAIPRQKDED